MTVSEAAAKFFDTLAPVSTGAILSGAGVLLAGFGVALWGYAAVARATLESHIYANEPR